MMDFLTSRAFKGTVFVLLVAGLIILPFFLRPFGLLLVAMWMVHAVAALGLNLTLGYAGQISMAQGAFVGIGAYCTGLMTLAGVPYPVAFLCSGVLCFAERQPQIDEVCFSDRIEALGCIEHDFGHGPGDGQVNRHGFS